MSCFELFTMRDVKSIRTLFEKGCVMMTEKEQEMKRLLKQIKQKIHEIELMEKELTLKRWALTELFNQLENLE